MKPIIIVHKVYYNLEIIGDMKFIFKLLDEYERKCDSITSKSKYESELISYFIPIPRKELKNSFDINIEVIDSSNSDPELISKLITELQSIKSNKHETVTK